MSGTGTGTPVTPPAGSVSTISTIDELIRANASGCPDFVIERVAIRVLRDFCSITHIWQETNTVTLAAAATEATFAVTAGEAFAVSEVTGYSDTWTFTLPATIVFEAAATTAATLEITAAVKPLLTDTEVPTWLLERHEDAIVAGIYARLLKEPSQAWTNPVLAGVYAQEYKRGIGRAKVDLVKKNKQGSFRAHWG